jgi:endogenous inhibitor of DNA gyrase (YacG/DUF329 family)
MSPVPATCPTCKRPIEWSEAFPFRPFCSDRCRLVDLNGWLSERHAIAGDPTSTDAPPEQLLGEMKTN